MSDPWSKWEWYEAGLSSSGNRVWRAQRQCSTGGPNPFTISEIGPNVVEMKDGKFFAFIKPEMLPLCLKTGNILAGIRMEPVDSLAKAQAAILSTLEMFKELEKK